MLVFPVIRTLVLSFLVTVFAELVIALLWRIPAGELSTVVLVNLVTNPPYVLLVLLAGYFLSRGAVLFLQIVCETLIFLGEGALYRKYLKTCRRPYLFSVTANAVSLLAGILLSF